MSLPDYYEILQVSPNADVEVIKAAYKRLAVKYHPDSGGGTASEDMMKLLNSAYEILSNPSERQKYDASSRTVSNSTKVSTNRILVYESDFSVASRHWNETEDNISKYYRLKGAYHILVKEGGMTTNMWTGHVMKDFEVHVGTQIYNGVETKAGVVFRVSDNERFGTSLYVVRINNNRHYEVQLYFDGKWLPIEGPKYCSALRQNASNTLRVRMVRTTMLIAFNSRKVTNSRYADRRTGCN